MLATGFAEAALPQRLKSTWRVVALAALAIFCTMRLRNILVPVGPSLGVDLVHVAAFLDRYAFCAALIVGTAGYLSLRPVPVAVALRRKLAPLFASAAALATSTAAGLYVIAVTMLEHGWSGAATAPLVAAMGELTLLICVVSQLRTLRHHMQSAARRPVRS